MTMKSNTSQIHNFLNIICIDQSSFSFDVQQMDFEYKIFSSIYVALDKRKSIGKNIAQVTMVILYQFEYFSFDFPVKMLIKKTGENNTSNWNPLKGSFNWNTFQKKSFGNKSLYILLHIRNKRITENQTMYENLFSLTMPANTAFTKYIVSYTIS